MGRRRFELTSFGNPFRYCNIYIEKACENYVVINFFFLPEHLFGGVESFGCCVGHTPRGGDVSSI